MKKEKWFVGLSASDILVEMQTRHETVLFDVDNKKETDSFEVFEKMFLEVIDAIVYVKTEFWAYRNDNDVYSTWSKLENDLIEFRVELRELLGYC